MATPPQPGPYAADLPAVPAWLNKGDKAWQLTAATFVGIQSMPGLVVLYGSIVKKKWAVNSAFMALYAYASTLIVWVLVGFRMAFGDRLLSFWGKAGPALAEGFLVARASFPATAGHGAPRTEPYYPDEKEYVHSHKLTHGRASGSKGSGKRCYHYPCKSQPRQWKQIEIRPRMSDAFHTVSFGTIHRQWEQQKASNVVHIHNALLPVKGMSILISHKIHDTSIASSEPSRTVPSQCQLGSKKHVAGVRSSCPCRSQTSPTASSLKQLCCDR